MKSPSFWLATALMAVSCDAARIVDEPFNYPPASTLTGQNGGTGWFAAWFQDGESVVTDAGGLSYTDTAGNILNASGLSANTAGASPLTTRSLREFESNLLNDVWVSFLYQLPSSNSKFEGVSLYRGAQQVLTVSNPSTTATASIFVTNNLTGNAINTQRGTFATTHLIVMKLTDAGGNGGADRVEVFIDPVLTGNPSSPVATFDGTDFGFNRLRIAGQDGSPLLVDEFRVGDTFADVTPHAAVADDDSDDDGLTDAQEVALGLNPNVSDATLIAGIQAHPDWFDLYTDSGILELGNGGVILPQISNSPVNLIFEVQQSENLAQWGTLETFNRQIDLPAGKNFLRVTLQDQ